MVWWWDGMVMDGWRFFVVVEKQDKEGQHGLHETWGTGAWAETSRSSTSDEKSEGEGKSEESP